MSFSLGLSLFYANLSPSFCGIAILINGVMRGQGRRGESERGGWREREG